MKYLILFLYLPLALWAYEPRIVTPYAVVGYQEKDFYDDYHKIHRTLLIWYPVDPSIPGKYSNSPWDVFKIAKDAPIQFSDKLPVIIISHGYTGNPHQLSWLIRGLTHKGFIVIGIQHLDLIEGRVHVNHWQRALDVKMIIDQFSLFEMAEYANLNKIGFAGFSLGGTTGIWLAGGRTTKLGSLIPGEDYAAPEEFEKANEAFPSLNKSMMSKDWKDSRVKAGFIMAPAWSWLFDEESLRKVTIPIYLIAATEDKVLVTKNNAGLFARRIPKVFYQEIPGRVDHYIFISALNESQRKEVQLDYLLKDDPSIDRNWIQYQIIEEVVNFFNWAFKPFMG